MSKPYMIREDFAGLPVWVCNEEAHPFMVVFLTSDDQGEDVNNCPSCGADVLESFAIYPLFLSTKNPDDE